MNRIKFELNSLNYAEKMHNSKTISEERAYSIAKNKYVKGEFKLSC